MKCTICHDNIVLTPSAIERAKKSGYTAAFYTSLFTEHSSCLLRKRDIDTRLFMQRFLNEAIANGPIILRHT